MKPLGSKPKTQLELMVEKMPDVALVNSELSYSTLIHRLPSSQ